LAGHKAGPKKNRTVEFNPEIVMTYVIDDDDGDDEDGDDVDDDIYM